MNVFVLCTGRCGSTTFIKACGSIMNYTSAHESMFGRPGAERFGENGYPDRHIEADTNMSWFLGPLRERYGDDAYYVHLRRDREATAQSFVKCMGRGGFADAYAGTQFLSNTPPREHLMKSCLTLFYDYVDTVTSNIRMFLEHHPKDRQVVVDIESPADGFTTMWKSISAKGNLGVALRELRTRYNCAVEA